MRKQKFPTQSEVLSMQMEEIFDNHNDPKKQKESKRKKDREKRRISKIKDLGI